MGILAAYLPYIPNPVNLLFSELLVSHKDGMMSMDTDFRNLIYEVLFNFAQRVEYVHRIGWRDATAHMALGRAKAYRKKLDKFLWRGTWCGAAAATGLAADAAVGCSQQPPAAVD